jgi:hypothetical protein
MSRVHAAVGRNIRNAAEKMYRLSGQEILKTGYVIKQLSRRILEDEATTANKAGANPLSDVCFIPMGVLRDDCRER